MSSISYAIISKVLQVLQTPTNELTTPITIFLPRDAQTRMITYDAYFTDKSRDGDGVEGLNRGRSLNRLQSQAQILLPSPVFSPLEQTLELQ